MLGDLIDILSVHYPGADWSDLPSPLRFASWIGGDRDGNPNVTVSDALGIVAMWEMYDVFEPRGLGFTASAQVAFWVLWSIPLLHDRAIHPRARSWN